MSLPQQDRNSQRLSRFGAGSALVLALATVPVQAQNNNQSNNQNNNRGDRGTQTADISQAEQLLTDEDEQGSEVSPVRRIRRGGRGDNNPDDGRPGNGDQGGGFYTIDGSDNNPSDPTANAAHSELARLSAPAYADGIAMPAGADRPSARVVSNQVHAQTQARPNALGLTDYLWQWGQFLDHDLDLTDGIEPPEPFNVQVPTGDPWFDPLGTGQVVIRLNRSLYETAADGGTGAARQQINEITGWIDGSNVYGSDPERAAALRSGDGSGELKISAGNLLPFNVDGFPNAGGNSPELFLAGDPRANEQLGLAAMHTLFVREHNRLTAELAVDNPDLTGDQLYAGARRLVVAMLQVITFEEFLPALLGPDVIAPYRGYSRRVDARIANEFATSAYRMGHSLLPPMLLRLDADLNEIPRGHLSLADAFFSPAELTAQGGIEPLLRGLSQQVCQDFDIHVVDEVRNFLFGIPGQGGIDLASLNIQRGRDHGLPDYNTLRVAMGLSPVTEFSDISSNPIVVQRLSETYQTVDQVDPWTGGLAEDALDGAMVGELVAAVIADQFERLRDGDRFWYTRTLNRRVRQEIENTRLADIIRRNTTIGTELGDRDVFRID